MTKLMIRMQVRVTEHQRKALRALSASSGRSIAELIRQSVDRQLAADGAVRREEQIQRAIRVAGRFKSGATDVSTNHNRYLAKAYDARHR